MNFHRTFRLLALASILLTSSATPSLTLNQVTELSPVLVLKSVETIVMQDKSFLRYNYFVDNAKAYSPELFAPAPTLPPCGSNTNASRTWVDFYDSSGKKLNTFCALAKPGDLTLIWFALDADQLPPSYVYIEMNDRQTNTKYKSNLADTTL